MATKQELEVQVAELQKQLADQTPPDILQLKAEIENLGIERDLLKASIAEKDAGSLAERNRLISEFEQTRQEDEAVANGKLSKLQAKLTADFVHTTVAASNQVVLDGVAHDIIRRDRAVDLVTAWRGRYVEDDDLVLVVKKA